MSTQVIVLCILLSVTVITIIELSVYVQKLLREREYLIRKNATLYREIEGQSELDREVDELLDQADSI